jgi:hypothetical protein
MLNNAAVTLASTAGGYIGNELQGQTLLEMWNIIFFLSSNLGRRN